MRALCWYGPEDVRVEQVPDPSIVNPHDAIVKITSSAICGSDLHLYDGCVMGMMPGDVLGHEFMGEVVEVGKDVRNLSRGDRVVVPFAISCGRCWFCKNGLPSLCDNSNPNAEIAEAAYGQAPGGFFGYSHVFGGYAGGQAEYARVPFADIGPLKVDGGMSDDQLLFLSDILPTGWMAAVNGEVKPGDVVAVWGCGPVGQFAILSAKLMGADRVIAIDNIPERLEMAHREAGGEPLNFEHAGDVVEALKLETGGRGPDVCIDCVGMEAHGRGRADRVYDKVMQTLRLETDRPVVLREMIQAARKNGRLSIAGVYTGFVDRIPMGAAFNKGLTFRMGQAPVHEYMRPLLEKIKSKEIDPTFVITHKVSLEEAPRAYRMFRDKEDGCVKVIINPQE